jgi:hypothetical protein
VTQRHRHERCHKGEQNGEYKRFWQPTLHQSYAEFNHLSSFWFDAAKVTLISQTLSSSTMVSPKKECLLESSAF